MSQYDDWLNRAQTGGADDVVAEIAAAMARHQDEPAWLTRAYYLTAIAHSAAGRGPAARTAAAAALQQSRLSDSPG